MSLLREIPQVDKLLQWPPFKAATVGYPLPLVKRAVRELLAELRLAVRSGAITVLPDLATLTRTVQLGLQQLARPSLQRVINGTGVVIHTNLGRAPLPLQLLPQLTAIACGYSNLEYDLAEGGRGSRYRHLESLLCELTGAEAALVVNNNAAALLLALAALANRKEVIVSRGELVEIGGSFRIPEVMQQSGALLHEVGTTNRTHPADYRKAVNGETALLLKVETSNFAMVGYTTTVTASEMAALGDEFDLPVLADLGSGNLVDMGKLLGVSEPTVQEFIRAGVEVVTCSGDKLLGGPQAGIIVGKKIYLEKMRQHPLLRALRVDKLTIAALEGVLQLYRDEQKAFSSIPVLRLLATKPAELAVRGRAIQRQLKRRGVSKLKLTLQSGVSQVGGGALPLLELPTTLLALHHPHRSPQELERRLRSALLPVIGRIARESYLLDLRTILPEDIPDLLTALQAIAD